MVHEVASAMRDQEVRELVSATKHALTLRRPGVVVCVIAFQSVVYDVITATRIDVTTDLNELKRKVDTIMHLRGGGTDMEQALEKAEHQINTVSDESLSRRIILLTDGRVDGVEENCLNRAALISERGVMIDGLGFGKEFDYKFMQRLVSFSSGSTAKIDTPSDITRVFEERVKSATNVLATNVMLKLTFTPQVRAGRGYRYNPEMLYLGNIRLPGDERSIDLPIGNIELDKAYSYVLTMTVGSREEGPMRAIAVELRYDIPSMNLVGGTSHQSVVVNYTDDPSETSLINGEVERAFDEVEIGRLVGELERAMGQDDHKRTSMFFDVLSRRYQELGDEAMASHYQDMKQKYAADGALSQEDMNYNRHRSTQKRDTGVQLVDASELI